MRGCLHACVLVLVAATAASAATYRVHIPGATRVEAPAVTRAGNWDVTVSFDPELCVVSCEYRLRTGRFGIAPAADLLLPPPIFVQVYSGAAAPRTICLDPCGVRRPVLAARERLHVEESADSPARLTTEAPPDPGAPIETRREKTAPIAASPATPLALPLRI